MNGPTTTRASPVRQLIRRGMSATIPRSLFMTSGPPGRGAVAITFDDGPDPVHTPAVLDRLRELGVRATFFVVGAKADAHPSLVERMVAEGHEVGHHSYTHTPPESTTALQLVDEARRTAALIVRVTGTRPTLFRPPHGKLTPGKLAGVWALRQTVVLWNRDPKDFASGAVDPIRDWFRRTPLDGGDIVLLHDVHPHVAPALDVLCDRVAHLGLRFETPADWRHA